MASLNYLLSSLVWRQNHNGFSHQDLRVEAVLNAQSETFVPGARAVYRYLATLAGHVMSAGSRDWRPIMYQNSVLSAGQLALIAVVPVLCLAIWLVGIFIAARDPRRRESGSGTASPATASSQTRKNPSARPPDRRSAA